MEMHRKKFWKNIISIFSLSILWYLMDMRAIYYIAISLSIYVLYALIRYRENNRVRKINCERRLRGSKTALCIDANIQAKKVPLSLLRAGTFWGFLKICIRIDDINTQEKEWNRGGYRDVQVGELSLLFLKISEFDLEVKP